MIVRQFLLMGIALGWAFGVTGAAARTASTTLITFDEVTDGMFMPNYTHYAIALEERFLAGQPRRGRAALASDVYTGSTPEVTVTYAGAFRGWASAHYPEGDGATGGAIYNTQVGVGAIIFTAAAGYRVRVNSLVLRVAYNQPSSSGLLEYSLDAGRTWTVKETDVAAGSTGLITFDDLEGAVVQIRWSDKHPGKDFDATDVALDNISYTAIPVPSIL